jgi:anti-sigma B factor antagonist
MGFSYELTPGADGAQLALRGEVDLAVAGRLLDALTHAILNDDSARVTVDLQDVSLLDSIGVSALVTANKIATSRGGRITLTNPTGIVRRVLTVTGVWPALGVD